MNQHYDGIGDLCDGDSPACDCYERMTRGECVAWVIFLGVMLLFIIRILVSIYTI